MRSGILVIAQCFFIASLEAQIDSVLSDSLGESIDRDNLLEQTVPNDNSNILDETLAQDTAGESCLSIRSRLESMLQTPRGYADGKYLGSPLHSYQKMSWLYRKKYQAGILFEKDPGEKNLNDFTSFHFSMKNIGFLSRILLGDYLIECGQGVALWRSNDYTKGVDIIKPLLREGRALVPYLSSNEQNFLRGGAATCEVGPASLLLFYSRKNISTVLDARGDVQSLYGSGQFQTASAISHRDNTSETILGGRLNLLSRQSSQVGFLWFVSHFNRMLILSNPGVSGQRFSVLSADYNITISHLQSFGELMVSNNRAGGIGSLLLSTGHAARSIFSLRYYPTGLSSLHGLGFSDGSGSSNETGLYVGCELEPRRSVQFRLFYDQFSSLAPSSSSYFQSGGHEFLFSVRTTPFVGTRLEIQFRQKVTQVHSNETIGSMGILYDDLVRYHSRIEIHHDINVNLRIAARWEYLELHYRLADHPERGAFFHAEVSMSPSTIFRSNIRLTFFSTDSYNTRFYAYEKNLDGAVSIPAVYGEGIRWYAVIEIRPNRRTAIDVKYSDFIRDDLLHLGSGPDELPTNHDNRIGIQFDIRL